MDGAVTRTSVRVSAEVYRTMKRLVDGGAYSSMSDLIREAVIRMLKEHAVNVDVGNLRTDRGRPRQGGSL